MGHRGRRFKSPDLEGRVPAPLHLALQTPHLGGRLLGAGQSGDALIQTHGQPYRRNLAFPLSPAPLHFWLYHYFLQIQANFMHTILLYRYTHIDMYTCMFVHAHSHADLLLRTRGGRHAVTHPASCSS